MTLALLPAYNNNGSAVVTSNAITLNGAVGSLYLYTLSVSKYYYKTNPTDGLYAIVRFSMLPSVIYGPDTLTLFTTEMVEQPQQTICGYIRLVFATSTLSLQLSTAKVTYPINNVFVEFSIQKVT